MLVGGDTQLTMATENREEQIDTTARKWIILLERHTNPDLLLSSRLFRIVRGRNREIVPHSDFSAIKRVESTRGRNTVQAKSQKT